MINIEITSSEHVPIREFTDWNIEDCTYSVSNISYEHFFVNHMIRNLPCIVRNVAQAWKCSEKWINDDCINFEYMTQTYGDMEAPVADCNDIIDFAQRTSQMKVSAFLKYMQNNPKNKLLYLKDLHMKKLRPNDDFYMVPTIFASDWLNEYAQDNNKDDFKFVYIGPKGSWTPLHVDVYSSYSWSVNVIGRKKWILFPPGEEEKLKNRNNQLQLLYDPEKNQNVKKYIIIQEKSDALFVPSGWYHQVENQLDTISINHNWNNGCNIVSMWETLNKSLVDVEHEIGQFWDSPDFIEQCQTLLKALCGANYESFISFVLYIAKKRLTQLQFKVNKADIFNFGINHITFDLKMVLDVINLVINHTKAKNCGLIRDSNRFFALKQEITNTLQCC